MKIWRSRARGDDFGVAQWMRDMDALSRIAVGRDFRRLASRITRLHSRSSEQPICGDELRSFTIRIAGRELDFQLRENQSDWYTFAEIFLRGSYTEGLAAAGPEVRTWVDVGAHVGLASLALHCLHPGARVVCVEPTVETAQVLRQNTKQIPGVAVVEAAVAATSGVSQLHPTRWWSSCTISPRVADARHHSPGRAEHRVALPAREVTSVSLQDLFAEHELEQVDVLKLDLEGAEELVLQPPSPWLSKVRTILLDLHVKYVDATRVTSALELAGFRRLPQARERLETMVWQRLPASA